ncbi:hypothetical protein AGLY_017593 [Aphis glycines]|uniref:Uncharacterized protein n=1 Tax=Aphis glycines TaxID=307491 RepID=A0A6G0SUG5_APHGL|nr:hypothetical protein AGLY_017593 [Aphis glycines]
MSAYYMRCDNGLALLTVLWGLKFKIYNSDSLDTEYTSKVDEDYNLLVHDKTKTIVQYKRVNRTEQMQTYDQIYLQKISFSFKKLPVQKSCFSFLLSCSAVGLCASTAQRIAVVVHEIVPKLLGLNIINSGQSTTLYLIHEQDNTFHYDLATIKNGLNNKWINRSYIVIQSFSIVQSNQGAGVTTLATGFEIFSITSVMIHGHIPVICFSGQGQ